MECLLVFFEHIQHILFRKTLLGDILHLVFYLKKMYMLQKTKEQSKSNLIKVIECLLPTRTNQSSLDDDRTDTGQFLSKYDHFASLFRQYGRNYSPRETWNQL